MTTNSDQKRPPAPDRAARLKAALRENLKRRKAQTRARTETADTAGEGAGPDEARGPDASAGGLPPRKDR